MGKKQAEDLWNKYLDGTCTADEEAIVESWLNSYVRNNDINIIEQEMLDADEQIKENIFQLPRSERFTKRIKLWAIAATSVAASLITLATWIHNPLLFKAAPNPTTQEIKPGGNNATLMLSNGQSISLSKNQKGVVIAKDKLSYTDGTKIPVENLNAIQTISTPKGGQYQIELPDGTKVWLNSSTIVQYAANLNLESGNRKFRLVEGEAYFEVNKDKKHPFIITTEDQEVTVLGTQFNISAYDEKSAINTTLLEGSIKVSSKVTKQEKILLPGQKAINTGNLINIQPVDVELETAWKRGKTEFEDADLKSVMRMLERWYDVETVYKSYPAESRFTGTISRDKNISAVLKLLESTGEVHFKIEGRKATVMK